jgi:hypothetical protein
VPPIKATHFIPATITAVVWACLWLAPAGAQADQTFSVSVPGTADIFAAGLAQPPALPPISGPPGTGGGTVPPSVSFTAAAGQVITFPSVTGEISYSGPEYKSMPNGNPEFGTDLNPVGPISGIINPESCEFLAGVLLGSAQPTGAPPASLNFASSAMGDGYSTLSPQLGQTFFIGAGSGSGGALHQIIVPSGATRLFLGIADGLACSGEPGTYDDNGGAYDASVTLTSSAPTVAIEKVKVTSSALDVKVKTSAGGTVTITDPALRKTVAKLASGVHTIKVPLSSSGKRDVGRHTKIKVSVSLTVGAATVSTSEKVRL